MVRTLAVSRTTVRQALQMLMHDGLIIRIPGKGTFVAADAAARQGNWMIENIGGIITAGYVTKIKFLGSRRIPASEGVAKSFGIPTGTPVTEFRKLQYVDDDPFFHIVLHVPTDLAAKVPVERIEEKPVFALLEEYCTVRIQEAQQWMDASLADRATARHLRLKLGDPVLFVERHFVDDTGRVVEIAKDHYRTDRMRHFLRLRRSGMP
jgi:GntR family transcriptional regulator